MEAPLLFLLSASEALFLPIPADVYIALYALSHPWWEAFAVGLAGNIAGGVVGYLIGRALSGVRPKGVEKVEKLYQRYGDLAIAVASLTPIPYKLFTYASGYLRYPLARFLALSLLFRGARFAGVAYLSSLYGEEALEMLQSPEVVSLLLLLLAGYALFKILSARGRR